MIQSSMCNINILNKNKFCKVFYSIFAPKKVLISQRDFFFGFFYNYYNKGVVYEKERECIISSNTI